MRARVYDETGWGLLFDVFVEDGRRFQWVPKADLEALIRRERLTIVPPEPPKPEPTAQRDDGPDESGLSWLNTE
jgi:hypothetical protein